MGLIIRVLVLVACIFPAFIECRVQRYTFDVSTDSFIPITSRWQDFLTLTIPSFVFFLFLYTFVLESVFCFYGKLGF